jgi:hypothetical protein
MDRLLAIGLMGVAALAAYAVFGRSPAMLLSAIMIGVIVYLFRRARIRERIIAIIAAGLGGSMLAEIALTFYRHATASMPAPIADRGEHFMVAIVLGLIDAVVIILLLALAEIVIRHADRKRE